jgi:hypothetical protein
MAETVIYLLRSGCRGIIGVKDTLNEIAETGGGCKDSLKVFSEAQP